MCISAKSLAMNASFDAFCRPMARIGQPQRRSGRDNSTSSPLMGETSAIECPVSACAVGPGDQTVA